MVELMYCDFMGRAGDEVFKPACKMAGHVGRLLPDARGDARIRGQQVRRAAFPGTGPPSAPTFPD